MHKVAVKTGNTVDAGTDAKISQILYNEKHESVSVKNLESWRIMREGHNYFEKDNLVVFTGVANCGHISILIRAVITPAATLGTWMCHLF